MVVFTLLLNTVHVFLPFLCLIWTEKHGNERVRLKSSIIPNVLHTRVACGRQSVCIKYAMQELSKLIWRAITELVSE